MQLKRSMSVHEALQLHKRLSVELKRALGKYATDFRNILQRCQSSKTVRDYFMLYPLAVVS
jgi:hypothetical protein